MKINYYKLSCSNLKDNVMALTLSKGQKILTTFMSPPDKNCFLQGKCQGVVLIYLVKCVNSFIFAPMSSHEGSQCVKGVTEGY